jgi:hypothetical protein
MTAVQRRIMGKVAYLDEARGFWGSEAFSVSIHPGGRTIRCVSELDGMGILRDTNSTLDNAWRPREACTRLPGMRSSPPSVV